MMSLHATPRPVRHDPFCVVREALWPAWHGNSGNVDTVELTGRSLSDYVLFNKQIFSDSVFLTSSDLTHNNFS